MERDRPGDIASVLHLMRGDSGLPGGRYYVFTRDSLSWGPSAADPVQHAHERKLFWGEFERRVHPTSPDGFEADPGPDDPQEMASAEELEAALRHQPERPVVLWTTRTWSDRLFLWWVLDAIERAAFPLDRFWIAESTSSEALQPAMADPAGFGYHGADCLTRAFSSCVSLSAGLLGSGASLWREFAAESPLSFDTSRRTGHSSFPELESVAEPHGWFFPRAVDPTSFIRLSMVDQAILGSLSATTWTRPLDVLLRFFPNDIEFPGFVSTLGDIYPQYRLSSWCDHAPNSPAVRSRPEPEGLNGGTNVSYQLTDAGVRLVERGFQLGREVPPTQIGGCEIYGAEPASPMWVRCESDEGWWLERVEGAA